MELRFCFFFQITVLYCYGCFPNPSTSSSPTMVTGPMMDPGLDPTVSCNSCPAPPYDSMNSAMTCTVAFMGCTMNNRITVQCNPPMCHIEFSSSNGMDTSTGMPMRDIVCTPSGRYTSAMVTDITSIRCNP